MLVQKTQNLVIVIVVITVVIILSASLIIGSNKMIAQAKNNSSLLTANTQPEMGTHLTYQGIYTNSPNFSAGGGLQSGQLKVVTDLKSAIAGSGIEPQSINSGFEYIPSSAFRPDGSSPASEYRFVPVTGYIRNNSVSAMCLTGPVYVPNGVTLTRFSMFFVDDNAANDLTFVKFWRKSHSSPGGSAQEVASVAFPGVDEATVFEGFTTTFTSGTQTIDNNFGYYIGFCFNGNTGLEQLIYGFRVEYK